MTFQYCGRSSFELRTVIVFLAAKLFLAHVTHFVRHNGIQRRQILHFLGGHSYVRRVPLRLPVVVMPVSINVSRHTKPNRVRSRQPPCLEGLHGTPPLIGGLHQIRGESESRHVPARFNQR